MDLCFNGDEAIGSGGDRGGALPLHYVYRILLLVALNGATFANAIVTSLRQIGGDAAGTGQAIYPGKLINLGMQVYQQTLTHVNWLQPESIVAPIMIAVIILIVCALIAVNMILLLCAA